MSDTPDPRKLYDTLLHHDMQREDEVIGARARTKEAMPAAARDEAAATADPALIRDEVKRRGLAASFAGLKGQRRVMRAQIKDEIEAVKVLDPTALPPLRSVDVAAYRAKLIGAKDAPHDDGEDGSPGQT